MKLIQCPDLLLKQDHLDYFPILFLAGGITSCPQWQDVMVKRLSPTSLVVLNPRRKDFDITDPTLTEAQIRWEHHHLGLAHIIVFWFPQETMCPITLFELGRELTRQQPVWKKLFIGCHPGYLRKQDVRIQTKLIKPDLVVHDSLDALCDAVLEDRDCKVDKNA